MASRICMNTSCGATSTSQWKKGWVLKSGQIADLCFNCGSAFEKLAFCDTFHSEEAGWRECSLCNKRLHCGCSASAKFIEVQDFGGVWCINCAQNAGCHLIRRDRVISEAHTQRTLSYGHFSSLQVNNVFNGEAHSGRSLLSLGNIKEPVYKPQPPSEHANASTAAHMQTEVKCSLGFNGVGFSNLSQPPTFSTPGEDELNTGGKDTLQPQAQPSLDIRLSSSADAQNFNLALPVPSVAAASVEDGEKTTAAPLLYQLPAAGKKPRHILPKPHLKFNLSKGSEVTAATKHKVSGSLLRTARPPAEGRLRNQLLPRYWPRISDQELQELSGDLNSTIVPLFEKILSASDASRIGRLVLPKACAEAYFPPINQSEGLPLKIQDVKGNEWTFQFRFWPNNNSRMYVLEGVTPCIQSMQLQAGDTVIFSRIDPGGKLVMGFRKASNSPESQDPPATSSHNDVALTKENIGQHGTNNQATANGYSSLFHSMGGSKENNTTVMSEPSNLKSGDNGWNKIEKVNKDLMQQPGISLDKKRSRNIGSKSKRLSWQHEDALELRISWEEIQDLLRAPPSVQPNVITIDEFEFEEYSEPPVFGKRTLYTTRLSGGQDQWVQCDNCAKWRKLPVDVLLPSKWSCSDNFWDSSRSSCSMPAESGSKQLDNLLKAGKETKKRRTMGKTEVTGQGSEEPSGLDALATAAALGDEDEVSATASAATVTTTRHPRHKPGCSCIVCIQPPSGKGKHKPNCVCNVCMTVKRRFKTLMIRKKKRQSEREAEAEMIAQPTRQDQKKKHDQHYHHSSSAQMGTTKEEKSPVDCMDVDSGSINRDLPAEGEDTNGCKEIIGTTSTNNIDLNCHPIREDETQTQLHADRNMLNITPESINQSQVCSLGYEPKQPPASVSDSISSVLVQFQPCQIEELKHQPSEGDQIFQQQTPDQDDYHRESVVSP